MIKREEEDRVTSIQNQINRGTLASVPSKSVSSSDLSASKVVAVELVPMYYVAIYYLYTAT